MNNQIFEVKDIPSREKDKELWDLLENKHLPRLVNFFMINILRTHDSLGLTNEQVRSKLASAETMQKFLDFILCLPESMEEKPEEKSDEDTLAELH